ncbi:hypothetical protein TNCV_5012161 [Trichonephila clavipes]|nr:hypothetical protein TNCV_5012161 [Trichonephila clavipes]
MQQGFHFSKQKQSPDENDTQCRFKLILGPGRRRSIDPQCTGGSKFITRKSSEVQLIRALLGPWVPTPSAQWLNRH